MSWRFNEMRPGDLNVDPNEGEFFATEALSSFTDALVREAIQNSLDAAMTDVVRVRFLLGEATSSEAHDALDGLWDHVEAAHNGSAALPKRGRVVPFLAFEDEGTRGLEGDPRQFEDDDGSAGRNDFYYFWRNVGRSRKDTTDRGRWGIGKTVFPAASALSAFFGLTRRHSDGRALLMGQCVLRIHKVGSVRYQPYGYFARREQGLAIPFDESARIDRFVQAFGLRRAGSGLSIVVPHPDPDITSDALVGSVLEHYFHPLLAGRLEVEIEEQGRSPTVLRNDTLERAIRRAERLRHLLPTIELARWGLQPEAEATASVQCPAAGRAPKLADALFQPEDLQRLRERYDRDQRIALEMRVAVERKGEPARPTSFRLLIERDPKDQKGEGYFVRQGITIENPKARRPRGVRWIVVVTDGDLSAFLGDSENPAHTEWQRSSPKFKEKYKLGASTLDFVRLAPSNIASLLSRPTEGRDPYLLRAIFSLSSDAGIETRAKPELHPGASEEDTLEEEVPAAIGANGSLVLGKVRTGFRLRGKIDGEGPRRLEVSAAYDVLRGNAFKRYSPLDFRMDGSIAITPRGVRVIQREENRVEMEVEESEFDILFARFDENRDLRVKVRPLEDAQ